MSRATTNRPRDPRLAEAIDIVRSARGEDGRWALQNSYRGKTYFELERLGDEAEFGVGRSPQIEAELGLVGLVPCEQRP